MEDSLPPLSLPPIGAEDWRLALAEARLGELAFLVEIVRDFELSASQRDELATLLENDLIAKPRKGRPRGISPWAFEHVEPVYRALTEGGPGRRRVIGREAALSELARLHGVHEDTIRDALEGKHTYKSGDGEKPPGNSPRKRKR